LARQLIKWHPIYIELIEGSGERLVIAIAGGTTEEVRVKMIEGFHEAFGPEVEAALAATRPMLNAVTEALRNGSIDLLSSADALGPGLFVGEARQIMTADIDATLEAAALISSSVFNAWLPEEQTSQTANRITPEVALSIIELHERCERASVKFTQNRQRARALTNAPGGMNEIVELIEELENQIMRLKLADAAMRTASGDQAGKLDFMKAERIARWANEATEHIRKQGDSMWMFIEQFMAELDTARDEFQPAQDYIPVTISAVGEQSSATQSMPDTSQSASTIH
jgi:hypothetical protein